MGEWKWNTFLAMVGEILYALSFDVPEDQRA
jgi:hypothetical protein